VVVEPPAEFRKWVDGLDREVPEALEQVITEKIEPDLPAVGAGGA
jgi:hypothetical protein